MKNVSIRARVASTISFAIVSIGAGLGAFLCDTRPAAAEEQESSTETEPLPPTEIFVKGANFLEPLQQLPQSATVVQGHQLQEKGQQNVQDVLDSVPNLSWAGGTSRPRFFLIRGIGEFEQYEGAPNPSIATIVDGIDFSGLGVVVPFFDIDQVEVLRGPQSVRYGASGLAGAVGVRSIDPSPITTGRVELSGGNDEFGSGGAAVGGAVPGTNEQLQLRFSAFKLQSDGFRDNVFLSADDTNERDESMARLKVRYQPSSDLTVDWAGWVVDNNNGYDVFTIDNSLTTQSDRPGQDALFVRATSLTVTARLSDTVKLQSISTGFSAEQDYSFDGDWGNNPFWGQFAPYDFFSDTDRTRRVLSEELRVSSDDPMYEHGESVRWLAGGFAQRLSEDTATAEFSNGEQFDYLASDYEADTEAVFGQVELPLGNATSLSTALRYEHRSTHYDDSRMSFFSPEFNMMGGDVTLAHDLSERVRVYASASRGFKGGGINAGPSVPQGRRTFDDEYLWSFETGLKGNFFDKRLSSNVALFRQLRRDQQLKFAFQDNPSDPLSFTYISQASGRGQSTGVELENTFDLTQRVRLFASGALLDTEFTAVPEENALLEGREFSHAPNWQYLIGGRYSITDALFTRVEVTGKDAFYFDDSNNQRSSPYHLLNASIGYQYGEWGITGWGRNLTDEQYAVRGFFFGNEPPDFPNKKYVQLGDPRAFGVTLSYNF